MSGHPLALTGERTLPGVESENYFYRRHEAAYREVVALAGQDGWSTVVDAGCGEGYGADLLATVCATVVAVDLDASAIAHVRRAYPRLEAVRANLVALPLAAGCCDAVVSLQVIEHLWDVDAYLGEVASVLRPGGAFVCATPNRLTFSPDSATPRNPFHSVEFTAAELAARLEGRFADVTVGGVWHAARLAHVERERGTGVPQLLAAAGEPCRRPEWLAALVADVAVDDFTVSWPHEPATLADSLDLVAFGRRR